MISPKIRVTRLKSRRFDRLRLLSALRKNSINCGKKIEKNQEQQARSKPKTNTETTTTRTTRTTTLPTITILRTMNLDTTRTTDTTNSDIDDSDRSGVKSPPTNRIFNTMPRPRQPDTPLFNGTDITEFLRCWNIEWEDVRLTKPQRCGRLPCYCTPNVKDVIELLDGYVEKDRDKLQGDLTDQYWRNDTQKNNPTTLNRLIRDAPTLDLNVYILK